MVILVEEERRPHPRTGDLVEPEARGVAEVSDGRPEGMGSISASASSVTHPAYQRGDHLVVSLEVRAVAARQLQPPTGPRTRAAIRSSWSSVP